MRAPILNRKKVYGGARNAKRQRSAVDTAQSVDTPTMQASSGDVAIATKPAPTKATRLDKDKTIELAKQTLCSICLAQDAPSNAKATAARTLLELVGALGRHADPASMNTLPASEMTLEQLEARIAALSTVN